MNSHKTCIHTSITVNSHMVVVSVGVNTGGYRGYPGESDWTKTCFSRKGCVLQTPVFYLTQPHFVAAARSFLLELD